MGSYASGVWSYSNPHFESHSFAISVAPIWFGCTRSHAMSEECLYCKNLSYTAWKFTNGSRILPALADVHIFLHSGTHKVALVRLHVVRRADDNALRNHFRLFNHRAQVFFIFHRVDRLIGERRRIKLPPHIIDADADRHPLRVQGKHVALIARKQVFRRIAADAGVRKTNAQLRVSPSQGSR